MSGEINWSRSRGKDSEEILGPHRDYSDNLRTARIFKDRVSKSLPTGLSVNLTGSQQIPESLFMIAWQPSIHAKIGNCATPIFLHQSRIDFSKKLETIFNIYLKTVKDFNEKKQLNLFDEPEQVKNYSHKKESQFKTLQDIASGEHQSIYLKNAPEEKQTLDGISVFDNDIPIDYEYLTKLSAPSTTQTRYPESML